MRQTRELRDAVARAMARAKTAGRSATVFDLYASVLDIPDVERMIRETGGDVSRLASELHAATPDQRPVARGWFGLRNARPPDSTFRRTIATGEALRRAAAKSTLGPSDVFVAGFLLRDPRLTSILENAGVSRLRLLRWLSGGIEALSSSTPDGEVLDVVLVNDDYTTMEVVVRTLTTVFGLDAPAAHQNMMTVHQAGRARIGAYPREEATRLVRLATEMAEAEQAPLRIILSLPEPPSTEVRSEASLATPSMKTRRGRLPLAVLRRLCLRLGGAATDSSDAIIVTLAFISFGVWLAFDRHAAGPNAQWTPHGFVDVSWYALGLLAAVWVLHGAARPREGFRTLFAGVIGTVPLVLALALGIPHAPDDLHGLAYGLLALLIIGQLARILGSVGASRPRAALLVLCAFSALFGWSTARVFVYPHFWYQAPDDDPSDTADDTERLLFVQADRIDDATARLRARVPGRPNVFFVGFAGEGHQKVFTQEAHLAERVVSERYDAGGRSLLLINDTRDSEAAPLATVSGLERALARIGELMDRSEDVLFLMLTSHGSDDASISVSHDTWPLRQLEAENLRSALDDAGVKWRVIVISACYSGAFIGPLADDNTMIFTSSAKDRTSFGCGDEDELTDFGAAFIREALPRAPSLMEAFEQARRAIAARERREHVTASLPQAYVGAAIKAHWERVERLRRPR